MSDLFWVAAALLSVVAIITLARKWSHGNARYRNDIGGANSGASRAKKTYPAVGIRHNLLACKAVQKYYDQRFLANDAPALPVPGCNVRPCPCRYTHYSDRRAGEDRRTYFGIRRNLIAHMGGERRRNDRRHIAA